MKTEWLKELDSNGFYDLKKLITFGMPSQYLARGESDKVTTLLSLGGFILDGTFIKRADIIIPEDVLQGSTNYLAEIRKLKEDLISTTKTSDGFRKEFVSLHRKIKEFENLMEPLTNQYNICNKQREDLIKEIVVLKEKLKNTHIFPVDIR